MTIQTLRRFWKALEQIPGGEADALEWRQRLGEEWQLASRYLRPTNALAEAVSCPSPGGDECPRKVIDVGGGRYRAVCRARPRLCDTLDLKDTDVAILALDRPKLFKELAAALDSSPTTPPRQSRAPVVEIGRYAVVAGVSAPVFMAMPDPRDRLGEADFRAAGLSSGPAVILLLASTALPPAVRGRMHDTRHDILLLPEVIGGVRARGLVPLQPAGVILHRVRGALQAGLTQGKTVPGWLLPPDTQWEQITMRLTSREVIACTVFQETRTLDPGALGLSKARSGKAATAWVIVTALARNRGHLRIRDPKARESGKKQIEAVRAALKAYFGLTEDPIPWKRSKKEYIARFVISEAITERERQLLPP